MSFKLTTICWLLVDVVILITIRLSTLCFGLNCNIVEPVKWINSQFTIRMNDGWKKKSWRYIAIFFTYCKQYTCGLMCTSEGMLTNHL